MVTSKEDRKEDGYMKHFISDHTPMDDYQGILQQAYYTIESNEEYIWEKDDNEETLKKRGAYRFIDGAVKALLLLAGILFLISVSMLIIRNKTGAYDVLGRLSKAGLLFGIVAFGFGILLAVAGAWMESHYAKADKKVQDDRKRRTLLLKNGDIAVVYLYGGKGAQMSSRFSFGNEENMVELPFSKIYRISGVYSTDRKNGRIVASVKCLEYMMIHPYVNEYSDSCVEHFFRYYMRKVRRTIQWTDKLLNADKLFDALQVLEKRK